MPISQLISRNFPFTYPLADIGSVIGPLSRCGAMIIPGENIDALPAGVLTIADISSHKGKFVKDCLCDKPVADLGKTWPEMLSLLHETSSDILIVVNDQKFEGLIWREDLLAFLRSPFHTYKRNEPVNHSSAPSDRNNRKIESDKILKALYNNSSAVRLLLAPDYTILYLNKATEEKSYLFHNDQIKEGDNSLDYLSHWFESANPGFTSHFKTIVDLALTGENVVKEIPLKFSLEPFREIIIWFRIACFAVWDEGKLLGISVTVTDINEKKKHELFIQNQNRILTEIIYTQSHEVRGPLSNILGIISLMEDDPSAAGDPQVISWLKASAKSLDEMIAAVVNKAGQWKKPH